ncbi:uncharacterized protein LOC125547154 [Triticum urartu]|uniref:uncharacterized protein LOC125547154 n=1 Tax=Triticum urartu TaxID=4572 RepID=UPI002043C23B|nr:uncharacterized protein LOC125547154 [Triticum urartu]
MPPPKFLCPAEGIYDISLNPMPSGFLPMVAPSPISETARTGSLPRISLTLKPPPPPLLSRRCRRPLPFPSRRRPRRSTAAAAAPRRRSSPTHRDRLLSRNPSQSHAAHGVALGHRVVAGLVVQGHGFCQGRIGGRPGALGLVALPLPIRPFVSEFCRCSASSRRWPSVLPLVAQQFEDTLVRILLAAAAVSFAPTLSSAAGALTLSAFVEPLVIFLTLVSPSLSTPPSASGRRPTPRRRSRHCARSSPTTPPCDATASGRPPSPSASSSPTSGAAGDGDGDGQGRRGTALRPRAGPGEQATDARCRLGPGEQTRDEGWGDRNTRHTLLLRQCRSSSVETWNRSREADIIILSD